MTRSRLADQAGFSLLEVMVAVSLMGLTFAAIVGGMMTSVVGSDVQRKQASADAAVRSYAESVKVGSYANCAVASDYSPGAVGYSAPSGFTASVDSVTYWHQDESDRNTGAFTGSCGTDQGLQQIGLRVASDDARATQVRQILKRRP